MVRVLLRDLLRAELGSEMLFSRAAARWAGVSFLKVALFLSCAAWHSGHQGKTTWNRWFFVFVGEMFWL